jgi:membrane-bound lytic murein transglycosylase D
LSIVESALNRRQFLEWELLDFGSLCIKLESNIILKIDSYVDERSDPLKSTAAAAKYMSNMYSIWRLELVLASYNSMEMSKAIRRSGKQSYWDIRKHLPRNTGICSCILATMYLYEYHNEHGIKADRAVVQHFATDTIMIKSKCHLSKLRTCYVPVAQLQLLNPSYKLNITFTTTRIII